METPRNIDSCLASAVARRGTAIMGVCNVTPDSFSDGGKYEALADARARVDTLIAEGADIVDIGGESTRPGAEPVSSSEQLARVLEVVRYASPKVLVSIDTQSPTVADACLRAGAGIVNDVSCLRDRDLANVAARHGATLVLMHSRGLQEKMEGFSKYPDAGYGDVVSDVLSEWEDAAVEAQKRGVSSLAMDPGLGFSKNALQSLELLKRTAQIVSSLNVPIVVGASRKSFLQVVDRAAPPAERLGASIAAAVFAAAQGASVLRVHDVRATCQAVDLSRGLRA